ncbi:MAG: hypothetical protein ACK4YP_15060, partial [Myxococcota bacterium]
APLSSFRVHGDVTALGSAAVSRGPAGPRGGARVTAGVEWQPARPFAVVADLNAGFGYAAPLDHVAAAIAVRAGIGKRVGVELGATLPLAGRERTLAAGELRVGMRLGKLPSDRKDEILRQLESLEATPLDGVDGGVLDGRIAPPPANPVSSEEAPPPLDADTPPDTVGEPVPPDTTGPPP